MSVKIKTEETNWNECHIERSFETGLQKFARFNEKVGKLIDTTSSKELLVEKLKSAVLEYYALYQYAKRCYFNLKEKKNLLETENQSLKDQLEKEKELSFIRGYNLGQGQIEKLEYQLEKAEKVIEEFKDIESLTGMELEYKARQYFQEKQDQLKGE